MHFLYTFIEEVVIEEEGVRNRYRVDESIAVLAQCLEHQHGVGGRGSKSHIPHKTSEVVWRVPKSSLQRIGSVGRYQ